MYVDSGEGRQQGVYLSVGMSISTQHHLDGQDDAREWNMEGRQKKRLSVYLMIIKG